MSMDIPHSCFKSFIVKASSLFPQNPQHFFVASTKSFCVEISFQKPLFMISRYRYIGLTLPPPDIVVKSNKNITLKEKKNAGKC
jgi:hypothetical protein